MEDAHIANLDIGDGNSLFAVFDEIGMEDQKWLSSQKTILLRI